MVNGWKVTAIIFIILFLLETISFIWIAQIGTDVINNENICSINVCGNNQYDSFYYDSIENICYCYTNGEITYQEVLE
jgi:hypothetical protein